MKIKNLKDVEETIKCIAQIDAEISAIDNNATIAINKAKEEAAQASAGLAEQREKLLENLKTYSDENRTKRERKAASSSTEQSVTVRILTKWKFLQIQQTFLSRLVSQTA